MEIKRSTNKYNEARAWQELKRFRIKLVGCWRRASVFHSNFRYEGQ